MVPFETRTFGLSMRELISEMKKMFDHRPSKMKLHRQFEKRSWRYDESFTDYYYDKVILADKVPVDKDELVDFIIDRIPETHLRNQARMHRFGGKEEPRSFRANRAAIGKQESSCLRKHSEQVRK